MADEAAGFLPWSGAGDSWIAWQYPHPRVVAFITIWNAPEPLQTTHFELWCDSHLWSANLCFRCHFVSSSTAACHCGYQSWLHRTQLC